MDFFTAYKESSLKCVQTVGGKIRNNYSVSVNHKQLVTNVKKRPKLN